MSTADHAVYMRPTPEKVAEIVATKGMEAAAERWFYLDPRTLATLNRQGRVRLGGASSLNHKRHAMSAEDTAVAVEASFALGSMGHVERAMGLGKSSVRTRFDARGLDYVGVAPQERGRLAALSVRAKAGDPDAVASVASQHALEREVVEVVRRALALVPEQPTRGRFVMPAPGPELDAALAGLSPLAIAIVFPAAASSAPVSPSIERITTMYARKTPADPVVRADHAAEAGNSSALVDLATRYGVTPKALYTLWRKLGLDTSGRCGGMAELKKAGRPKVEAARDPAPAAPAVRVETSDRLDIEGLALAAELAKRTGIAPAQAIAFVRADRASRERRQDPVAALVADLGAAPAGGLAARVAETRAAAVTEIETLPASPARAALVAWLAAVDDEVSGALRRAALAHGRLWIAARSAYQPPTAEPVEQPAPAVQAPAPSPAPPERHAPPASRPIVPPGRIAPKVRTSPTPPPPAPMRPRPVPQGRVPGQPQPARRPLGPAPDDDEIPF